MQLGMVGLGKMGGRMTPRLLKAGHEVVVYHRSNAKSIWRPCCSKALKLDNRVIWSLRWSCVPARQHSTSILLMKNASNVFRKPRIRACGENHFTPCHITV